MEIQKYVAEIRRWHPGGEITCSVYPVIWMNERWVYVKEPENDSLTTLLVDNIYGNIEKAINSIPARNFFYHDRSPLDTVFCRYAFINGPEPVISAAIESLLKERFDYCKNVLNYRRSVAEKYIKCAAELKFIGGELRQLGCTVDEKGNVLYEGKDVFKDVEE